MLSVLYRQILRRGPNQNVLQAQRLSGMRDDQNLFDSGEFLFFFCALSSLFKAESWRVPRALEDEEEDVRALPFSGREWRVLCTRAVGSSGEGEGIAREKEGSHNTA